MTVKYEIRLEHADKGIGFLAKRALQNAGKQGHSPIDSVRIVNPTSTESRIIVALSSDKNEECLRTILEKSGIMPSIPGTWHIVSIEQILDGARVERVNDPEEIETSGVPQLVWQGQGEVYTLKARIDEILQTFQDPVKCLLNHFERLNYVPSFILEEKTDLLFARNVFQHRSENTFLSYLNFATGESYTQQGLDTFLAFDHVSANGRLDELEKIVSEGREEQEYLSRIERGEISVPKRILTTIKKAVKESHYERTVQEYEQVKSEVEAKYDKKTRAEKEKEKYPSLSEKIELLQQASSALPTIIHFTNDSLELYFPFNSRQVKAGFSHDLISEVKEYFSGANVAQKDHTFIAYNITGDREVLKSGVEKLHNSLPFTLRLTGFDRIIPYQIGCLRE